MCRCALSVRLLALLETTLALMLISPLPAVDASVEIVMLLLDKFDTMVLAPIPLVVCAAVPAAMVKSMGSISQSPVTPWAAVVFTRPVAPISKVCPDVST